LLFDLGLDEEVIGITKFCVHPEPWFRNKIRIGGTKKLNLSLIHQLQPDLIIANKEENVQSEVEELAKKFPVWISDVKTLEDAYNMIAKIGELVGKSRQAGELIARIQTNFKNYLPKTQSSNMPGDKLQTGYFIWKNPYMSVGGDTFISDMMNRCGFNNVFEKKSRYPELSIHQLPSIDCQLLLLSSEPYPFQQKDAEELRAFFPGTKIVLVNGEMFSWYGSRLQHAPAYFSQLRELIYNS
jgi:ABC-type Fe3+-hydroxamate transport system substrate-binding protein